MIEVQRQLPRVYYNESRDFQLLGRIFEILLNYLKTNADIIEHLNSPETIDERLVSLLATTVGFESRHAYDTDSLRIICGCFHDIIRYKGTMTGIERAVSALLNAQGIKDEPSVEAFYDTKNIEIFIPAYAKDVIILKDLFEYILPVGWSYSIMTGISGDKTRFSTKVTIRDTYTADEANTSDLDVVAKLSDSGRNDEPVSTRIVPTKNVRRDN